MIEYKVDGKMAIVTGVTTKEANLVIPEEIEGYIVSKIAENAFSENDNIKKVTIPKTVKVISSYAFSSCHKLTELIIQDGTEVIEDWAFTSCPINKIILPPSVRIIGNNAFLGADCKPKVDEFVKMKNRPKAKRSFISNAFILPITAYTDYSSITPEYIAKQSDYIDSQFDSLERGYKDYFSLDIPFIFNGDQFIICFYSDKKLDYLSVDLANETKKQIGLYKEDDPTYIAARIDVFSHDKKVAIVDAKMPYLEKVLFTIENQEEIVVDDKYCYYLTISADIESYGNGNIDFEFSFNAFDDLYGKFQSEADSDLISLDDNKKIIERLDDLRRETLAVFFRSLVGAPLTTFLGKIYEAVINNEDIDKETLLAYYNDQIDNCYYGLTNVQTLTDMVFNVDNHIKFLEQITKKKISELSKQYDIYLVSDEGIEVSKNDLAAFKERFPDIEENYFLHAEMMEELFIKLRDLNREFAMLEYKVKE